MKKHLLLLFIFFSVLDGIAQLKVDIYPTEEFMVKNMLIGNESVKVWNVEFGGAHDARGVFYNQNTPIPIAEGILLTTGHAKAAQGPNKGTAFTGTNKTKGDQDLHFIAKYKTYDASWISFEFEAINNLIKFNYVFASEEYPEYVGSAFNDAFGFFLTDLETGEMKNLAVLPNTNTPITVNNINHKKHSNFYIKNAYGKKAKIEYDGLTALLIAYSEVTPGRKYRIKIAIADVADNAFDSGVFLQGKSFVSQNKKIFYQEYNRYFEAFTNEQIVMVTPKPSTKSKTAVPKTSPQKKTSSTPHKSRIDSLVILFDFDKGTPTSSSLLTAQNRLNKIDCKKYRFKIVGHTDQKGSSEYNVALSKKRAEYVKNWMNNKYQTQITTIQYKSFNQLINSQTSETARAQNRRVVIYFKAKNR